MSYDYNFAKMAECELRSLATSKPQKRVELHLNNGSIVIGHVAVVEDNGFIQLAIHREGLNISSLVTGNFYTHVTQVVGWYEHGEE